MRHSGDLLIVGMAVGVVWLAVARRKWMPLAFLGVVFVVGGPFAVPFALLFWLVHWQIPAWTTAAIGAFVLVAAYAKDWRAVWMRLGPACVTAGVALYGYGLTMAGRQSVFLDPRPYCPGVGRSSRRGDGEWGLVPLHDTTCGGEAVPWWVNPALGACALLLVASVVGAVRTRKS